MSMEQIEIREVGVDGLQPLRTQVLRPNYGEGRWLHYDGDEAAQARHYAAVYRGDDTGQEAVIAVVSYLDEAIPVDGEEARCRLRGMAVDPGFQRQGLGSHLLVTTLARVALQRPGERVWAAARVGVADFYAAHGFEPVGPRFEMPSVGPHQRMARDLPTIIAG